MHLDGDGRGGGGARRLGLLVTFGAPLGKGVVLTETDAAYMYMTCRELAEE